ncbi:Hpt domain-containing protein, partial [Lysobacter sp. D1-1-M9]
MSAAFEDQGSDIRSDFLVEAREILDQLGEQMVTLEHAPDDRECLNAVFRGFHTIKGGAGFLDFKPMVTICHAVEDRFDAARSGRVPLDPVAFDGAQQALDLLVDMLDCIAADSEPAPVPELLLASLRADGGASAGGASSAADSTALSGIDDDNLDDLDFDALLDSLHGAGALPGAAPAAPAPAQP